MNKKVKKFLILLFIFITTFPVISLSQNILEENLIYRGNLAFHQESDETVTGIVISKYENGETKEKGKYVEGLRELEWKKFHENGKLLSTTNYNKGFKNGTFEVFFEDGKLKALGSYKNDKELFNLQCWALTCQSFFSKEEWIWLYKKLNYTGDYEFFYFHGRWQMFHMNGRLYSMGNFSEGKKEGMWEYFDEEGKLNKIQIFEKDVLIKCEGRCPEIDDE